MLPQVGAPARVGLVAPTDVLVPAGNTGLDPSQTNFFQVGRKRTHRSTPVPLKQMPTVLPLQVLRRPVCLLQALNIPTKINKGTVEIAADVQLIQEGNKVGASEATLLAKLGIKPFSYGLVIRNVRHTFLSCLSAGIFPVRA